MKGIIDANLLLVLEVGLNDPRLLGRKKHVAEYCKEDFDVLCGVLNDFDRLLVTPNIITECSNLAQHAVVTADGALARAAQSINHASVNFNHVRTGALLY